MAGEAMSSTELEESLEIARRQWPTKTNVPSVYFDELALDFGEAKKAAICYSKGMVYDDVVDQMEKHGRTESSYVFEFVSGLQNQEVKDVITMGNYGDTALDMHDIAIQAQQADSRASVIKGLCTTKSRSSITWRGKDRKHLSSSRAAAGVSCVNWFVVPGDHDESIIFFCESSLW